MQRLIIFFAMVLFCGLFACKEDPFEYNPPKFDDDNIGGGVGEEFNYEIDQINDTYGQISGFENHRKWGPYNLHDPSVIKEGEYFFSYSTDAAYGVAVRPGIQVRRSKDLINWQYIGWAFNGLPPQGVDFIRSRGGTPFNSIWAPFIYKHGNEFRLYYSLSSPEPTARLSVIGLAVSNSPTGPWTERGLVVTSLNDNSRQTNAIDPAVVVDKNGEHWFYYGSAWDGIYLLKLDPATGMAAINGDKGRRVAQRGFTGNRINGNIEGPEVVYNAELDKYYIFISYDWLETKYNVRVGRGDSPQGPFYDFHGNNMNDDLDDHPMILAPYQFLGHGGWQGVSHPAIFKDNGKYFMAHQGRPGVDKFFMVMHVREILWTEDGWPVVSPQRYAGIEQNQVTAEEIPGDWEQIILNYRVVPGYSQEQFLPDFQMATALKLDANGTINGDASKKWSYNIPYLTIEWGTWTAKVKVIRGRDWENKVANTVLFTGLNNEGLAIWGKKIKN
jgi:arabinan endo-1,5-alpha-L-arabinosidase